MMINPKGLTLCPGGSKFAMDIRPPCGSFLPSPTMRYLPRYIPCRYLKRFVLYKAVCRPSLVPQIEDYLGTYFQYFYNIKQPLVSYMAKLLIKTLESSTSGSL